MCLLVILLAVAVLAVAPFWREVLVVVAILGAALLVVLLVVYLIRSGRMR